MKYALCLLTSPGRDTVERTLRSFAEKVSPRPSELLCYSDGLTTLPPLLYEGMQWRGKVAKWQGGFCRATRALWEHAATAESPWIFWLEDDFEFTRAFDLNNLALVLEHEPRVAQMALYRNPVNEQEIAAGGYIAEHPEEYERRGAGSRLPWFEHRHHFTTNPSLFRRDLTSYDWPDGPYCEGKFGLRLRELRPETTFGVWGTGDPWVQHIGERVGLGY